MSNHSSKSSYSSTAPSRASSPASSIHDAVSTPELRRKGQCNALIFDLGDVLFTWSAETKTTIPPKLLRKILESLTWFEYEKGNIGEQEAYDAVARVFGVPSSEVGAAFQGARDSLQSNPRLVALIRELKEQYGLKVFAMSNISAPDWEVLKGKATPEEWSLFDRVFTSAEARERKPNLGFYKQVLEATGVDPSRSVFVDDKLDNVISARSVGLNAIIFDSYENVARQLKNYVANPIGRAEAWLRDNAKKMLSVIDSGVVVYENFGQMLILEATGDRSLVDYVEHPRLFNFFQGNGVFTTEAFPCDLDSTSIGLTVTAHVDEVTKHSVLDEMLTYKNEDGIISTYFDATRPRIDPIVCANVLTCFYKHGRGEELSETLDWVYGVLLHRAYLDGTRYYFGADTFLFFLSRLLSESPSVYTRFAPVFQERVKERMGATGDAMSLAMRIIAAATVKLQDKVDCETLLQTQEDDGGFPIGWMYKYGATGMLLGNKGLSTALAIQAIKAVESVPVAKN